MSYGKRIGLLGGSFNPAHDGHLHISRAAFERLKIDEVWWMVSPQNPLKKAHDMSDFNSRIQSAKDIADDPRIIVSDIEQEMGTVFTVDTLEALKKKFPKHRFVWLMGADNLRQIPKWRGWRRIFRMVPIAIFPARPTPDGRWQVRLRAALNAFRLKQHGRRAWPPCGRPPGSFFGHNQTQHRLHVFGPDWHGNSRNENSTRLKNPCYT